MSALDGLMHRENWFTVGKIGPLTRLRFLLHIYPGLAPPGLHCVAAASRLVCEPEHSSFLIQRFNSQHGVGDRCGLHARAYVVNADDMGSAKDADHHCR